MVLKEASILCSDASWMMLSASPAATSTFLGTQPRKAQVPPKSLPSMTSTDLPASLAMPAGAIPAFPAPKTMTS
jgi:hypothetical protein